MSKSAPGLTAALTACISVNNLNFRWMSLMFSESTPAAMPQAFHLLLIPFLEHLDLFTTLLEVMLKVLPAQLISKCPE